MTLDRSDTSIALHGASNFRDLGGLSGDGGRRVRRTLVYRSDHLGRLNDDDLQRLNTLGVTHCVDLRGAHECQALPNRLPGITIEHLSIDPTVLRRVRERQQQGQALGRAEAVELMQETYQDFVRLRGPVFGQLLARIAGREAPLVFHCTAGKDRTGMAAALLLGALGVHRDDVMTDYLLTNRLYRRDARVEEAAPPEVLEVLWQVQPEFLHTAWRCIDEEFGGIDAYLAGPVGLDAAARERLRERLLAQG